MSHKFKNGDLITGIDRIGPGPRSLYMVTTSIRDSREGPLYFVRCVVFNRRDWSSQDPIEMPSKKVEKEYRLATDKEILLYNKSIDDPMIELPSDIADPPKPETYWHADSPHHAQVCAKLNSALEAML